MTTLTALALFARHDVIDVHNIGSAVVKSHDVVVVSVARKLALNVLAIVRQVRRGWQEGVKVRLIRASLWVV